MKYSANSLTSERQGSDQKNLARGADAAVKENGAGGRGGIGEGG